MCLLHAHEPRVRLDTWRASIVRRSCSTCCSTWPCTQLHAHAMMACELICNLVAMGVIFNRKLLIYKSCHLTLLQARGPLAAEMLSLCGACRLMVCCRLCTRSCQGLEDRPYFESSFWNSQLVLIKPIKYVPLGKVTMDATYPGIWICLGLSQSWHSLQPLRQPAAAGHGGPVRGAHGTVAAASCESLRILKVMCCDGRLPQFGELGLHKT
jgi:hypothetical protein